MSQVMYQDSDNVAVRCVADDLAAWGPAAEREKLSGCAWWAGRAWLPGCAWYGITIEDTGGGVEVVFIRYGDGSVITFTPDSGLLCCSDGWVIEV